MATAPIVANFKPGDLLYGLELAREDILAELKKREELKDCYLTADEFHNNTRFPAKPADAARNMGAQNDFGLVYDDFLMHSHGGKYHPALAQALGRRQEKQTKPQVRIGRELRDINPKNVGAKDLIIRRSCKALIRFITERRKANIHFLIDGMKATENGFTMAEFKYILKYQAELGGPGKIYFYFKGQPISVEEAIDRVLSNKGEGDFRPPAPKPIRKNR